MYNRYIYNRSIDRTAKWKKRNIERKKKIRINKKKGASLSILSKALFFLFIISNTHARFSIDRSIDQSAKWKKRNIERKKKFTTKLQLWIIEIVITLDLDQYCLLNALPRSFYLFIYFFFFESILHIGSVFICVHRIRIHRWKEFTDFWDWRVSKKAISITPTVPLMYVYTHRNGWMIHGISRKYRNATCLIFFSIFH